MGKEIEAEIAIAIAMDIKKDQWRRYRVRDGYSDRDKRIERERNKQSSGESRDGARA